MEYRSISLSPSRHGRKMKIFHDISFQIIPTIQFHSGHCANRLLMNVVIRAFPHSIQYNCVLEVFLLCSWRLVKERERVFPSSDQLKVGQSTGHFVVANLKPRDKWTMRALRDDGAFSLHRIVLSMKCSKYSHMMDFNPESYFFSMPRIESGVQPLEFISRSNLFCFEQNNS